MTYAVGAVAWTVCDGGQNESVGGLLSEIQGGQSISTLSKILVL